MSRPGLALFAAATLFACTPATRAPQAALDAPGAAQARGGAERATVFVSAELKGYLGPCGCSEAMRGGIARTAQVVAHARAQGGPVLYLDSGDALFGEPAIAEAAVPQQERKAVAVAEAMKAMGLSARAVGPLDDARGEAFRKKLGLPELPASGLELLPAGRGTLAVVAGATAEELSARGKAARQEGAGFVLGLWRTSLEAAIAAAPQVAGAVDFALAVKAKDELAGEQNKLVRAAVPLAQVQTKGRSILRVDLAFGGAGPFELLRGAGELEREAASLDQRIELLKAQVNEPMIAAQLKQLREAKLTELLGRRAALAEAPPPVTEGKNAFTVRFVPLESQLPEDPKARAIVAAYDKDVGLLNLAWAKAHGPSCPQPAKGEAAFIGNGGCEDCHEEAFESWNRSKHARGFTTLEEVGKQHHLDCIGCHVTGWQRPGGVCRVDQTKDRQGIGCESCHGPGSRHAEDPDNVRTILGDTDAACTGCHDRENSPHFAFERYMKEIIAPGHGMAPEVKKPRK